MQSSTKECSRSSASYRKFGAETLLQRLNGFENLIDGVIKNIDVECVHKTRVTSRRLRAALTLFEPCFSKKEYQIWCKGTKKVTKLLSQARDLDVQIAFIEQYTKELGLKEDRNVLNLILKLQKKSRKKIQINVEAGLREFQADGTLGNIQQICKQMITEQTTRPFDIGQVLGKAQWNIDYRLNDFLSMKQYVYLENAKLEHHEMRILAKKLRYTMECFSSLYKGKLETEIDIIKRFQDTLGEMHDNDVWLELIPELNQKIQDKTRAMSSVPLEESLNKLLAYVADRRKKYYEQFLELWEQCVENDFFGQLTSKTGSEISALKNEVIQQSLADPNMKIAVLSDIHANVHALEEVLKDAEKRGARVFLNAGDSIGFGACPNETVELLCEKNVLSIVGNYDLEVLDVKNNAKGKKRIAFEYARKKLSKTSQSYLQLLPQELRFEAAGKKLLVTHGSPNSIDEHIYHDTPLKHLEELADSANADVIMIGHSHEQFQRKANGALFVNPGSVGRPGDGNPQAGYAIISFNPFKVDLVRIDYDVKSAAEALRKKRMPESFAQMLLEGIAIDEVIKEDKAREVIMDKSGSIAVEASRKFSKELLPDTQHYQQVTNLTLKLFDCLIDVHKLGRRERCWLECAALLHDIGLSKGSVKHHKASMQLILNEKALPFPSTDRRVIASIARYHRKALPKRNHYNMATVDDVTVNSVCVLSSLLRLGDSLDYTHECKIKELSVNICAKKIIVECVTNEDLALEEMAFNKKKDLFEKVFKKKTVLEWRQR
jgi:putative phosphoesterase